MTTGDEEADETAHRIKLVARRFLGLETGVARHPSLDPSVARAVRAQEPVVTAFPKSPAAAAYRALAARLWKPVTTGPALREEFRVTLSASKPRRSVPSRAATPARSSKSASATAVATPSVASRVKVVAGRRPLRSPPSPARRSRTTRTTCSSGSLRSCATSSNASPRRFRATSIHEDLYWPASSACSTPTRS